MAKRKARKSIKNLAPKKVGPKKAAQVKGGVTGPGTQTEDEVYIGRTVRR